MNKRLALLIVLLSPSIVISSCHWQANIVVIKNTTSDSLIVEYRPTDSMPDIELFEDNYDMLSIGIEATTLSLPNIHPKGALDTDKLYIYIFNADSVNAYRKQKRVKGIVQHSFLRKVVFQLNKVKDPLDTIYIR